MADITRVSSSAKERHTQQTHEIRGKGGGGEEWFRVTNGIFNLTTNELFDKGFIGTQWAAAFILIREGSGTWRPRFASVFPDKGPFGCSFSPRALMLVRNCDTLLGRRQQEGRQAGQMNTTSAKVASAREGVDIWFNARVQELLFGSPVESFFSSGHSWCTYLSQFIYLLRIPNQEPTKSILETTPGPEAILRFLLRLCCCCFLRLIPSCVGE